LGKEEKWRAAVPLLMDYGGKSRAGCRGGGGRRAVFEEMVLKKRVVIALMH